MGFSETIAIVKNVLSHIGSTILVDDYDGVIVKRLEASNTLDPNRTTKQSHIAITGDQMDMFPYVRADGYFEVDYDKEDSDLKKYFVAQIPVYLHKENVEYLSGENAFFNENEMLVHVSIVRSRRNNSADQIQMSMTYMDSPEYITYRKMVHAGSYMIMLKRSKELMYDLYCVKGDDVSFNGNDLSDINNTFYKLPTNTTVHIDKILSYDNNTRDDEAENEYQRAANYLLNFISESGYENPYSSEEIENVRKEFLSRYSPEKLAALTDDEILDGIFYSDGDNSESLCFYLERNNDCRKDFGGIAGGSAFKFGLFKKKESGQWTSGSPTNPILLSEDEALQRGKAIRNALIKGVEVIQNAELNSLEAYEKLHDDLKEQVGEQFFDWAWFHKYFAIVCCDKLSCYHNNDWQNHILYSFGIKPSKKYYARSGQIAMIENYAGMYYRQFYSAHIERFGRVKTFFRIGTTSDGKSVFSDWIKRGVAGIGWNDIGPLDEYESGASLSKDEIADKLSELYYQGDKRTSSKKAGEITRFFDTDEDSVLVAANGEKILGLMDDLGEYFYDSSAAMAHMKPGKWHLVFTEGDKLPNKSEGLQTSCVQIKDESNLLYLYNKYYHSHEQEQVLLEIEEYDEKGKNEALMNRLKTCMEVIRKPRENKRFPMDFIIYGAPGTGKTYSTAEYALAIIENEDVDLSPKTTEQRLNIMNKYNKFIQEGRIVFTTFHQSYGYEEFIQGLRPDTSSDKMAFDVVDGVFKRIADRALNDLENNYVIIIDEINRANISKVFGELITLIEEDKRWGELNQLCATLQSGDVFAVPNNLYIVGTMNSADKSISLIDAALRRRFEFIEQKPQPELVADSVLKNVLLSLNHSLADELESSDLLIGHSYFMNKKATDLPAILNNSIIPLLYEYFYDNKKKVASVLTKAIENTGIVLVDDKMGRLSVKKAEL